MKKNKMMRLASSLLVAVLLTSSVISGTFAKYVTDGSAEDEARVAKFGVEVVASGSLFGETYIKHGEANEDEPGTGDITVDSFTDDDVLAPGTKNPATPLNLKITGQPEVDVVVTTEFTMNMTGWQVDGAYYCPLRITVTDGSGSSSAVTYDGVNYASTTEFIAAVTAGIKAGADNTVYEANAVLDGQSVLNKTITWEWPYHVDEARDIKDTKLGNLAAEGTKSDVEINWTVTVTQVD